MTCDGEDMEDIYSSFYRWPSISALAFLKDSVCLPETNYPMTRRKSRLWREGILMKQRSRGGSRSTSVLSTPPAEMDADLEQFLEAMDFSSFEDSQKQRDTLQQVNDSGAFGSEMEASLVSPTSLDSPSLDDMKGLNNCKPANAEEEAERDFEAEGLSSVSESGLLSENFTDEHTEKEVEISFEDISAHNIFIAGSFSNWEKMKMKRRRNQWTITLYLLPGIYYYKLVKDNQWICDDAKETVTDEFNHRNNCIYVGSVSVKLRWTKSEVRKTAFISGTFSNWIKTPMRQVGKYAEIDLSVPYGPHEYKFFINNKWYVDSNMPTRTDENGNVNNFRVFGRQDYKFFCKDKRAREVCVAGNFNGWKLAPLKRVSDCDWTLSLDLDYGTYDFKFVIDGKWVCDDRWPKRHDINGHETNFFVHGIRM
eukprot:Plantae.Rhodophyta-Purpureofilum_apyrenoidigerum.ctg5408.p1 GENE.Plantae.Rhodophyta-Purpureofilum_apyrenoidigerum.ctg5408~~Plantae.Rhodophyta-Purpureofilum_apyrenoidigerum.ctg5408.p1  ORF type:complete len:423 (-),score=86.32 Plantae.Rhodophyta-Purpureofilum_apyrenoidigerum.ctg5408:687-1955(-)